MEQIQCRVCGKALQLIADKHLKRCCGLTTQQYKERYPDAPMAVEGWSRGENNGRWKGVSARTCEVCGGPISRHAHVLRCRKCKWVGKQNPFADKQHSGEARAKMHAAAQRRDKATYKAPGNPDNLARGRAHYWATISDEAKFKHLASFIAAGQLYNKKSAKTQIETTVANMLQACGVAYRQNVQLGRYNVDFIVAERVIVECYGDYWHCNPRYFASDMYHRSLHMTAQQRWDKDARRQALLEGRGYQFLVFWETDIYADIGAIRKDILDALR